LFMVPTSFTLLSASPVPIALHCFGSATVGVARLEQLPQQRIQLVVVPLRECRCERARANNSRAVAAQRKKSRPQHSLRPAFDCYARSGLVVALTPAMAMIPAVMMVTLAEVNTDARPPAAAITAPAMTAAAAIATVTMTIAAVVHLGRGRVDAGGGTLQHGGTNWRGVRWNGCRANHTQCADA
jgi:hypothetical protein